MLTSDTVSSQLDNIIASLFYLTNESLNIYEDIYK